MKITIEDLQRIEMELVVLMWTAEGTWRRQVQDDPPVMPVAIQTMGRG